MSAPGHYVSTTGENNSYILTVGTSLAAPQVAAAAGLLYSLNPNITASQVEYCLKQSAFNSYSISDNNNWAGQIGTGRLDAGAALALAESTVGGCQPRFTDITWERQNKSGAYVSLGNNYDAFTYLNASTNNNLQFSITGATASVEWEFYLNGILYTATGSSVNISLSSFGLVPNPSNTPGVPNTLNYTNWAPMYCVNTLEVYVKQGSGCCYSAYYKEDAYNEICIYIKPSGNDNKLVEFSQQEKIGVYPSPASSVINVVVNQSLLKNAAQYQIISVEGKTVKSGKLYNTSTSINIAALAKGFYLFRTERGSTKFIKQ